jgi:thiamine biosynthesis protein ThiI
MKFVVKYFPEITIKSKPVRRRFVTRLADNLRSVLRDIDPEVILVKHWDKLQVETRLSDEATLARLIEVMRNCPGITYILEVSEHPLGDMDDIAEQARAVYGERLTGKTFAVRCKRNGQHSFTSIP